MVDTDRVWERIRRHAGEEFRTKTGLRFTYTVVGNVVRVTREGHEVNRSLSRTNFNLAVRQMPATSPSEIKGRQGAAYTWAILMDSRIRGGDW